MKVILTIPALQILRTLEKSARKTIGDEIRKFQDDRPVNVKKLRGSDNEWRLRAGGWRVIMEKHYDSDGKLYYVVNVVRRRDAYN